MSTLLYKSHPLSTGRLHYLPFCQSRSQREQSKLGERVRRQYPIATANHVASQQEQELCSAQRLASSLVVASLTVAALVNPSMALDNTPPPQPSTTEVPAAVNTVVTEENAVIQRGDQKEDAVKQAFLDMSIDGQPAGRIVIQTFPNTPVGSQRFLDLAQRQAGGYRLSKVEGISDGFITVQGVIQLKYAGLPDITGGETVEELEAEQTLSKRTHDTKGLVSLIVEDPTPKDVRDRIVAYQGKFIKVQEVRGASNANGTGFAITLKPVPELDKTNLIVGKVIRGEEVLDRIAQLPRVKSASQSPFFKIAKTVGDRRADIAARGWGRPLVRVFVQRAGLLLS